eukprot:6322643-Amphidinium_carterae.1
MLTVWRRWQILISVVGKQAIDDAMSPPAMLVISAEDVFAEKLSSQKSGSYFGAFAVQTRTLQKYSFDYATEALWKDMG